VILHLSFWTLYKETIASLPPVLLYVVMAAAYGIVLASDPSMRQPGRLALFTGLMAIHGILHWFSTRLPVDVHLTKRWRRLLAYFVVQGVLVFAIGYLTQLQGFIMGLYLALVGEVAGILWPDLRAIVLAASFYLTLLALNIVGLWGFQAFLQLTPVLGIMLAFVLIYVILYVRQVEARAQAQEMVQELETAHRQLREYADRVEELTLSQERQRMARELHDTLAQGLAGLILQLEAADSHLENDNAPRAQAVVQQAMRGARATLHEARRAIQALRPSALEGGNLIDALGREADQFATNTGLRVTFEVDGDPLNVSPDLAQDILRIVQESLTNVARHAQADHVHVRLAKDNAGLQVTVRDDGAGFDPDEGLERPGCFGMAGMYERAQRMGGELQIESTPGAGTAVKLRIPGGEK